MPSDNLRNGRPESAELRCGAEALGWLRWVGGRRRWRSGTGAPRCDADLIVVEPSRAACLFESARAGRSIKIKHDQRTVMAMLECYEPSLVAWRIISRLADGFMTVDEEDAVAVMRRLAHPNLPVG